MVIFHGIQHDFNHDLTPATRDMDGYGVNCETFGNQEPFYFSALETFRNREKE